jgi:hypothetical protein
MLSERNLSYAYILDILDISIFNKDVLVISMTKIKVTGSKGQQVDAEQLSFTPINENWSEYKLSDGKILRVRLVISEVFRMDEIEETTGRNNYMIKSTNIVSVEDAKP